MNTEVHAHSCPFQELDAKENEGLTEKNIKGIDKYFNEVDAEAKYSMQAIHVDEVVPAEEVWYPVTFQNHKTGRVFHTPKAWKIAEIDAWFAAQQSEGEWIGIRFKHLKSGKIWNMERKVVVTKDGRHVKRPHLYDENDSVPVELKAKKVRRT